MNSRASARRDRRKPEFDAVHPHSMPLDARPCAFALPPPLRAWPVQPSDLRIALFSGNYNYVRDGANQALNRLVEYLLRQGAQVRVYSPTVANPAFEADRRNRQRAVGADPAAARISAAGRPDRARSPRPCRVRSEHRPHRQPGHRRPPRGQLGPARTTSPPSPRSTRASRPISLIIICRCSSRRRARSCAGCIAAATRSSRRPNRWPRCCAPSG